MRKWRLWAFLLAVLLIGVWWASTFPRAVCGRWVFDEGAYLQELGAANPEAAEAFRRAGTQLWSPWMSEIVVARRTVADARNPADVLFRAAFVVHHHTFNCDCPDIIAARGRTGAGTEADPSRWFLHLELKDERLWVRFDQQLSGVGYPFRRL